MSGSKTFHSLSGSCEWPPSGCLLSVCTQMTLLPHPGSSPGRWKEISKSKMWEVLLYPSNQHMGHVCLPRSHFCKDNQRLLVSLCCFIFHRWWRMKWMSYQFFTINNSNSILNSFPKATFVHSAQPRFQKTALFPTC